MQIFTIRRGGLRSRDVAAFRDPLYKYFLDGRLLQNRFGYVIICIYYPAYGICRPFCPLHLSGPVCRFRLRTLSRRVSSVGYDSIDIIRRSRSNDPVRAVLSVGSVCRSRMPDSSPPCGPANRCVRHSAAKKRSSTEYECKTRDSYSLL